MPRVAKVTVYTVDELSLKAKERAFDDFCKENSYPFGKENKNVLEAFAKMFSVKLLRWEYGEHDGFVDFYFDISRNISSLKGLKLLKYLQNNYFDQLVPFKVYRKGKKQRVSRIIKDRDSGLFSLTGYWLDYEILKPIFEFLKRPYFINFYDLIADCIDSWLEACKKDYRYFYSMVSFIEMSNSNDWLYFSNGERFLEQIN